MNLSGTQLKDTYGNLVTTGTTAGSPTTGGLQNGDGQLLTQVGIGTNSFVANTPLTLQAPSGYTDTLWLKSIGTNIASRINIGPTGTGNAQINNATGTNIEFQVSGSEKMRIDSSGNITHSGTSPQYIFKTASNTNFQIAIQENVANALEITPSTTAGGTTFSNPALVIDSSGNVGIGTSPSTKLDVKGTMSLQATNSTNKWLAYTYTDNTLRLNYNGAGNDEVTIDSSGNVGIGVTPSEKLHVSSGSTNEVARFESTDGTAYISIMDNSTTNSLQGIGSVGDNLTLYANNAERLRVDSSGNVGINNTSPSSFLSNGRELVLGNGSASHGMTIFSDSSGTGNLFFADGTTGDEAYRGFLRYNHSSDSMEFYTAGANLQMLIDSSGNVGIGESDPDQLLHLKGTSPFMSISHSADNSTGGILFRRTDNNQNRGYVLYDFANDAMTFRASTTGTGEDMRIDSSGNVGIGNTVASTINAPNSAGNLVVGSGSGSEGITIYTGDDSNGALCFADGTTSATTYEGYIQYNHNTDSMQFATGHTERMRIASNGDTTHIASYSSSTTPFRVGFGTYASFTPTFLIDDTGSVLVGKTSDNFTDAGHVLFANGAGYHIRDGGFTTAFKRLTDDGEILRFYKDSTQVGSIGSTSGVISHIILDPRSSLKGAGILGASIDANTGIIQPCDRAGAVADNAINLGSTSNRWKNLYLGTGAYIGTTGTPNGTANYGSAFIDGGSGLRQLLQATSTTTTVSVQRFYNPNGNVGSIQLGGSATSFVTSSDYRLKENVVEMTGALNRVDQLKPSRFNFIADADTTVDGFLAHEVADVVPEAITGEKDATEEYEVTPAVLDDDGNIIEEAVMGTRPVYQGIDQSKLVPLLVGAIQELRAEIEQLKNQ